MDIGIRLFGLVNHALWSGEVDLVANGCMSALPVRVVVSRENDSSKRTEAQNREDEEV